MPMLFETTVTVARQQALPALKARAEKEGLIITTCGWCYAYISEQPGRGVNGISSGCCKACYELVKSEPRQ